MAKTLTVSCGTCRHPQAVSVSHIAEIDSDCPAEFVSLRLKTRHWIKDTFGDAQWHQWVVADRTDVLPVLRMSGAK